MLEIGLVVLGMVIIAASYVISERVESSLQEKISGESGQIKDVWTEKEEKKVQERIDGIVRERVEQAIDKTEDELSRISNEKIMSSNEFSEQVLEKIQQNHEEVVFLYNMLNEKEKQIKNLMQQMDMERSAAEQRDADKKVASNETKPYAASELGSDENGISQLREFAKSIEENEKTDAISRLSGQGATQAEKFLEEEKELPKSQMLMEETSQRDSMEREEQKDNRNKEILALHKKGMTVLEISKALDMGQGEVKLVIDLFQGAKA